MSHLSFFLYLLALLFAPLAFGAVEHWSLSTVEGLLSLSCLCFLLSRFGGSARCHQVPALLPFLLLLLWVAVQILPLPLFIVRALSPLAGEIYGKTVGVIEPGAWVSFSLHPRETLREFLLLAHCLVAYFLTIQFLAHRRRLNLVLAVLVVQVVAISAYAIAQKTLSPDLVYWFRQIPKDAHPFGPWVYKNHFASFVAMHFPLMLALFMDSYRPASGYDYTFREKLYRLLTLPSVHLHFFLAAGMAVMAASIVLSLSRGGTLSMALGLSVFILAQRVTFAESGGGWRGEKKSLVTVLAIIVLGGIVVGWKPLLSRFTHILQPGGISLDGRILEWRDSLAMVADFPVTGSGLGTFADLIPSYHHFFDPLYWVLEHAHNDWLELTATGGLLALFLMGWFVIALCRFVWQGLRKRRDPKAILLALAALTTVAVVLVHSLLDFIMYCPANRLYFFLFCGLAVVCANAAFQRGRTHSLLATVHPAWCRWMLAPALLLLVGGAWLNLGNIRAEQRYTDLRQVYFNRHISKEKLAGYLVEARTIIAADPLAPRHWLLSATIRAFMGEREVARHDFAQALRLYPLSGTFIRETVPFVAQENQAGAEALLRASVEISPGDGEGYAELADWYFTRNRRIEAFSVLRQALDSGARSLSWLLALKEAYALSDSELESLMPDQVASWLYMGSYYTKERKEDQAVRVHGRAAQLLSSDPLVTVSQAMAIANVYLGRKERGKAMAALRGAIENPAVHDSILHIKLGDLYFEDGISYRAREEYERALVMQPGDEKVRAKLRMLAEFR